jgi:hypothetical protein
MKKKFHIEYAFDTASRRSLWNQLISAGLSMWFADEVSVNDAVYTFRWGKEKQDAMMISMNPETSVRFRWLDEEDHSCYFEFRINTVELTGAIALEITDFAEPEEREDAIGLWDTQVEMLKRTLGI